MPDLRRWRTYWSPTPIAAQLVVLNLGVFMLQSTGAGDWALRYGLVPAALMYGGHFRVPEAPDPYALTIITSSFMHGNLGHLIANVAYIAVLGPLVERRTGSWRLAAIWFAAIVVGGLAHVWTVEDPAFLNPLMGASGGVAGLVGIAALSGTLGLLVAVVWVAGQFAWEISQASGGAASLAWNTHVGGFAVGVLGGFMVPRRRRNAEDEAEAETVTEAS